MLTAVFVLSLTILTSLICLNTKRARTALSFELKPNCLMTRYPLVFITGRRNLFYFLKYWNQIPEFLAEHGYQVFTLPLPWRNHKQRLHSLRTHLQRFEQSNQKFHLFFDITSLAEIETLFAHEKFACVESLTLVDNKPYESSHQSIRPLSQAIEELIIPEASKQKILGVQASLNDLLIYLDKAHFLAERDLIKSP